MAMIKKSAGLTLVIFLLLTADSYSISYKKYETINKKSVSAYKKIKYRPGRWKSLGKSRWGNRIFAREFGKGGKTILIIGGAHGDEPAGPLAVLKLAAYLRKNPGKISGRVVLIPFLNPDGLMVASRTNGRKVDINRNFPSDTWKSEYVKSYNNPGKKPGSEPETRIVMKAIKKYKPVMIIHLHQPFNAIYPGSLVPEDLAKRMSVISGIPLSDNIGYDTPGSLGSYAVSGDNRIPVITYEMGAIDVEPDYEKIILSLVEAINN